ncbi:MAG: succinate dehydrogenase cytochrome b subunit [Planctomycetota bacterium]
MNTLRWFGNVLASSIGRKAVMALTGLLLVGFLIAHLAGNLTLFADVEGAAFNAYAGKLLDLGPLLYVAEVGLVLLFGIHIYLAIRLTLDNREARRTGYVIRNDRGAKTLGSASMPVTGVLILGYTILHLFDFRFDESFEEDGALLVRNTLSQPLHGVIYVIAAGVVGLHVSHGFQSAFQSLGWNHPRYMPLVKQISIGLAALLAAGFAALPLYFLFTGGAQS